ncbi:MAG: hypothetical protein IPL58_12350 [Betaproteobacteria bacterium]|uniref:Uncharacterized protein n=1 Tax=Candidatus Proximibacter danicus TaxID=2954365 RepID=A0A9D7PQS7_9PROT|nr:hypothetical protein [Candidatus Proximibacter danicus]
MPKFVVECRRHMFASQGGSLGLPAQPETILIRRENQRACEIFEGRGAAPGTSGRAKARAWDEREGLSKAWAPVTAASAELLALNYVFEKRCQSARWNQFIAGLPGKGL